MVAIADMPLIFQVTVHMENKSNDLGEMSHFLHPELGETVGVIHRETLIHTEPPGMSYQLMRAPDYE